MASSNKTNRLKLPQWVGSDKPTMDDFNDAFEKIDEEANNSLRVVCHGQLTKTVNMGVGASDYWTVPKDGPDADIYLAYIGTPTEDAYPFAVSTGKVYSSGVVVNYQCLRAYNGDITFGFIGVKIP